MYCHRRVNWIVFNLDVSYSELELIKGSPLLDATVAFLKQLSHLANNGPPSNILQEENFFPKV